MSVSIFFSYSREDAELLDQVEKHLSALKRSAAIQGWHDRLIPVGSEWEDQLDRNLNTADIIVLLVSASFISSEYCWSKELTRAMERHHAGEAVVIPILLRPCLWKNTPFAKLQVLPRDAIAVTSWNNQDEALTNVAEGIWDAVNRVAERKKQSAAKVEVQKPEPKIEPPQVPVTPPVLPKQLPEDDLQSEKGIDYAPLRDMLKAGKWREADQETWRVMCAVAERQEEGWLRVEDVERFPCKDLRTIDQLWVKYSDRKFGFSVQKQIWQECGSPKSYNDAWKTFGDRVGWRVKNNWITYPDGVTFDTPYPKGHLPFAEWYRVKRWYGLRGYRVSGVVGWVSLLSHRGL